MIDIHILTHSGTRSEWLTKCIDSLRGQPVTVHVIDGIEGSVGAGRAKGFSLGRHDFVGYVDSDDFVLEGHYAKCLDKLKTYHAVAPKELVERQDGSRAPRLKSMHNGIVYRRADIDRLIPAMSAAPYTVDMLTRQAIKPIQLDHVGYVWRLHNSGAHRAITSNIAKKERAAWSEIVI